MNATMENGDMFPVRSEGNNGESSTDKQQQAEASRLEDSHEADAERPIIIAKEPSSTDTVYQLVVKQPGARNGDPELTTPAAFTQHDPELLPRTAQVRRNIFPVSTASALPQGLETNDGEDDEMKKFSKLAGVLGQAMGEHVKGDTERALKEVGTCTGAKPDDTLRWLRAVDDVSSMGISPLSIARKSAKAPLRSFIGEVNALDWPTLKDAIARRFISADFPGRQAAALQTITQRPGETLESFTHEFQRLVREAHPTLLTDSENRRLAKRYLSALSDRDTALRVVRQHGTTTLEEAISNTRTEREVYDHLEPTAKSHALLDETESFTAQTMKRISDQVNTVAAAVKELKDKPRSDATKGVCFRCAQPGHFARDCRAGSEQKPRLNPNAHSFKPQVSKCDRCRRPGHKVADCKSKAPQHPCRKCNGPHWTYDCAKVQPPVAGQGN